MADIKQRYLIGFNAGQAKSVGPYGPQEIMAKGHDWLERVEGCTDIYSVMATDMEEAQRLAVKEHTKR